MQTTLLDYIDISKESKILARIKLLAKQKFGNNFAIDKIELCKKCGRFGRLSGHSPYSRKIVLGIQIIDDDIRIVGETLEFHGDLCHHCYYKKMEKILDGVARRIYEVIHHPDIPILPHEAYWYDRRYIVELPGKKLSFKNKGQIENTVLEILRRIAYEEPNIENQEDLINKINLKVKLGEWLILELVTLIKLRHMRRSVKRVNTFEDVFPLLAYIERISINVLRHQYKDYGIILTHNRTIGIAPRDVLNPTDFEDIVPLRRKDAIIYDNIIWKIPSNLLRYFKIINFAKNKDNVLRIKTKHFMVYVIPQYS